VRIRSGPEEPPEEAPATAESPAQPSPGEATETPEIAEARPADTFAPGPDIGRP
jgi:hypothetical protein